jgi:signal transduction histidine kinase/AraC-like DNA-binding protein
MSTPIIQATILVVDDEPKIEPLFKLRFRKKIASGEFAFLYALNAEEALSFVEEHPAIDIVLLDINMPGMDGLTLLPKLTEINDALRVVMVSAYGDMGNIRKAMNLGAYDFVTKPIDFEDLHTTIVKTLREVDLGKRVRIAKELEEKNKALRELDQMKSRFFTNITHEIRTPLTAILGMADQIKLDPDQWLATGISVIERNGRRLLNLVAQVLDLRKLESGKLEVRLIQSDIIAFIHYLLESFYPLLESKQIQLDTRSTVPELVMDFDPDKMTGIFSNLFSNAVKYTPREGTIRVSIGRKEGCLQIEVADSGVGIAPEELPLVFDRFFRASSRAGEAGSGLGLALVKELVELLEGKIHVESEAGAGSTFTVMLPIKQSDTQIPSTFQPSVLHDHGTYDWITSTDLTTPGDRPHLLIVEDNIDVAQYLQACLEGDYLIHLAWNGQEGIDYAIENVPDIVISDVMMPEKDGYELCNILKNDRRTSHIPIILLTARADADSRIEGLQKGADAYLAKPFNREELFVRLNKLLELRKKLQERYGRPENLPSAGARDSGDPEEAFLANIRHAIENNLDNENFRVPELCRAVGASRTQLHRKIKALTNTSTTNFIRSIRLHKAKTLLQTTDLNVTQVAFEVGFSDPRYFSRTFHELFGQPPSELRKE